MQPGKRLVDKVAIVTGAASGIGAETARVFARHGASVLLTDTNARSRQGRRQRDIGSGRRARPSPLMTSATRRNGRRSSRRPKTLRPPRHPVQYRRHLRPRSENEHPDQPHGRPAPRRADARAVEQRHGDQRHRRVPRHEGRGAGHAARGRRLDHQHLLDLRHHRLARATRPITHRRAPCGSSRRPPRSNTRRTRSA